MSELPVLLTLFIIVVTLGLIGRIPPFVAVVLCVLLLLAGGVLRV